MSDLLRYIDLMFDYATEQMRQYQVDDRGCWNWLGRVKSEKEPYGRIDFSPQRIVRSRRTFSAHRVSYAYFKGKDPGHLFVMHTCDNPRCINPDHLVLGTHRDNMKDMAWKNRSTTGERNKNSKLTESQVREIVVKIQAGQSNKEIAESLPVGHALVSRIRLGKSWTHLLSGLDYSPDKHRVFQRCTRRPPA